MKLILAIATVRHELFEYSAVLGIYDDTVQNNYLKDFSDQHKDCLVKFHLQEFELNVMDEIDIRDLIP